MTSRKKPAGSESKRARKKKKHQNELLDEALRETFPASDTPAMLMPAPETPHDDEPGPAQAVWLVRATWTEDGAEASDECKVEAGTAEDAVRQATARLRVEPHQVEARRLSPASKR